MTTGKYTSVLDYCERMSISYSYKPVLILAMISNGGKVTLDEAAAFFLLFYALRLEQGQVAEKPNSIYSNLNCTFEQVKQNIKNNSVKALTSSSEYFIFDAKEETLSFEQSVLASSGGLLTSLQIICHERLERYYAGIAAAELGNITAFQNVYDDNGYLNNDYGSSFSVSGISFSSMTQYMTYRRALLSGDEALGRKILRIHDPDSVKTLAAQHRDPLCAVWEGQRQVIAYKGLIAKFAQNDKLSKNLLNTGSSIIAACFPDDFDWGTGLEIIDKRTYQIEKWPGKNLLGYTLMQVRSALYSTKAF